MKTKVKFLFVMMLSIVMMALAAAPMASAGPLGPGAPDLPSVNYYQTFTLFSARALTSSTSTTYTLSPTRFPQWAAADIFVTADVSGTDTLTATVQYSPDGSNWSDGTYTYVTWNTTGTATSNTGTYRLVISSDTTSFMRVPMVGEYMRLKIDNGGAVTPTIKATFKR